MSIQGPTTVTAADLLGLAPEPAPQSPTNPDLHRAAQKFESMFLRQLLESAHLGEGSDAYGTMAVESLATNLAQGGGLGLARELELAIARSDPSLRARRP